MNELQKIINDEYIERYASQVSQQAEQYYRLWKLGKVFISRGAFRAMVSRFQVLESLSSWSVAELCEFGRLYSFFLLLSDDFGELSPADLAVKFCNRLVEPTPPLVIDATFS